MEQEIRLVLSYDVVNHKKLEGKLEGGDIKNFKSIRNTFLNRRDEDTGEFCSWKLLNKKKVTLKENW